MPRVTVVIPAFNAEKTIQTAVESVLCQTYTDFETIVVDDGSTDDTHDVLLPYQERIRYVHQNNRERSAARNLGITMSRGEYIAFLDADDYWLPKKLERQVALLDRQPDLGFVFSWAGAFDQTGKVLRLLGTDWPVEHAERLDGFETLLLRTSPPMLTVVARKLCIERVGSFDESIAQIEDWDLWLRMSLHYPMGFVPEVLACYRLSGSFMPAKLARRSVQQNEIAVISRACDLVRSLPHRAAELPLERAAMRRAYFRAAMIDCANENYEQACNELQLAKDWDSAFFEDRDSLIYALTDFALNLYDTFTPPKVAQGFLEGFFHHLPSSLNHLRAIRRAVCRSVAAGHGFRAWAQHEPGLTRKCFLRALLRYPDLAQNRGIWAILARTFLSHPKEVTPNECECSHPSL